MPDESAGLPPSPKLQVYGFWRSQATFRLRVALNLKGIAYTETPVDIDHAQQDAAWFRSLSPMGSVPALMVDGKPLTQSLAILEYLEEAYPEPPLLPADLVGRARVRSLALIAAGDTHPLIVPRIKRYLAEHAGFDAASWKAWQTQWFTAGLRGFEARLDNDPATGTFCHGETATFADICLVGLYAGAKTFAIEVPGIPTVERIARSCQQLAAFDAARAEKQADFPG
jgi:maleylacetoacetate isomerase